jgi:hypothetical protein
MSIVVSRTFPLSRYADAVAYKEQVGGIMLRTSLPRFGSVYEVRLVPRYRDELEEAYATGNNVCPWMPRKEDDAEIA